MFCSLNMNILTFFIFVLLYTESKCHCRHSYVTFCDDLNDLTNYRVENWTELVIGHENSDSSQLRTIDVETIPLIRFEKLTSLTIVRQIKDLKTFSFGLYTEDMKIKHLTLYGNEIRRIRFSTFDSVKLTKLSLANNSIEYIHKEAFCYCEIHTIDLSNNKLESVEANIFTEDFLGNATKEMIFRNNHLESIQANSLPTSLEILNLDNNDLQVLDYDIFENLTNLKELTMSHNKLSGVPNVTQFKEIQIMDFSYNQILFLKADEFNKLSQLEVLDLSHNQLSYALSFNKFNFPERHPALQISLAFNRLTHLLLEDDSFKDHIVFLYGNPWDCKCLSILERFMKDKKVKRNQCDLQYFGTGQVPYCINNVDTDCNNAEIRDPHYASKEIEHLQFLSVIKKQENVIGCNLSPQRFVF